MSRFMHEDLVTFKKVITSETPMESYTLKPNKKAFFVLPFIRGSIALFIFFFIGAVILHAAWSAMAYVVMLVLFIALRGFSFYGRKVAYDKLTFTITEQKIIAKGGAIFTDFESELTVRNITHIRKVLPFLEHYFYKTGNIVIDSAGSGISQIVIESVDHPDDVFENIKRIMRSNGFSLQGQEVRMERSPNNLAVFLQLGSGYFFGIIGVIAFFVPMTFALAGTLWGSRDSLGVMFPVIIGLVGLLGLLVLISIPVSFFINFSEQKRRVYRVYNDMITYHEGFLTKVDALLPMENLSDTSLTQTLVDKLLDLADVKVSCQGTGQEIHFKNIKDGKSVSEAIDQASSAFRSLVGTERQPQQRSGAAQQATQAQAQAGYAHRPGTQQQGQQAGHYPKAVASPTTQRDTQFTAEYHMDIKRTLIPMLPFCLIFPPLLLGLIFVYLRAQATKFLVKPESVGMEFSFMSTQTQEFSADKVTGVVMKESLIDKLFETCSVHFWSVGSGQNVVFANVRKSDIDFQNILAKVGIYPKDDMYRIQSVFRLGDYLKKGFVGKVISFVVLVALIVGVGLMPLFTSSADGMKGFVLISTGVILGLVLLGALFKFTVLIFLEKKRADFSMISFKGDHVYSQEGFLNKSYYYALYDNVKDITTKRYPFSPNGDIRFNVAGEMVVQNPNNQGGNTVISSSFTVPYVPDLAQKDELIDVIMYQRPSAKRIQELSQRKLEPHVILEARPALSNHIVWLIIISVIIFPLILILPFTIPVVILKTRRMRYRIESYRVLEQKGVFVREQTSVIFSKIDHINTSRGMFNNIFKNGNITVNTTGSSRPELTLSNIPNYKEFYEELNKHY